MTDPWSMRRSTTSSALLLALGVEHGASPYALLEGTGMDVATVHDAAREITAQQEMQLIQNLVRIVDEPGLGFLAGARYHPGHHGLWTYALLSSPTVGSALELGLRYAELSYTFFVPHSEIHGSDVHFHIDISVVPSEVREFLIERDLTAGLAVATAMIGPWLPITELQIALPAPSDSLHRARYVEAFGVTPVWNGESTRITMPAGVLDTEMPSGSAAAAATAEQVCADLLSRRRTRSGFAAEVRAAISMSNVSTDQADIAARLHVSRRTLRRRLADEGTSYRELARETFGLLSEELLLSGLTIEQVAERLGYAGPSSFTRAFKSWRGVSPGSFARTRGGTQP